MKLINKSISSAVVAVGFLFASTFSANAAVIKHDIFDSVEKIGEITVEFDNSLLDTGILDTGFGDVVTLVNFNLGELFSWADVLNPYYFEVVIDSDNIDAGVEFFSFDGDDVGFSAADTWSYQLLFDAFDLNSSFIDVFTAAGDAVVFDFISLGAAEVSDLPVSNVSAPATLGVFALAMAGLYGRRKMIG
jgi:hypothetical protein